MPSVLTLQDVHLPPVVVCSQHISAFKVQCHCICFFRLISFAYFFPTSGNRKSSRPASGFAVRMLETEAVLASHNMNLETRVAVASFSSSSSSSCTWRVLRAQYCRVLFGHRRANMTAFKSETLTRNQGKRQLAPIASHLAGSRTITHSRSRGDFASVLSIT
ncbi:unnamed protein product [Musa acuminata var. zebrina]